ncbi:MAG TPA: DUF3472 domain-containing protein [Gammaproteobacteria bacterium]|jgi:hypothetical protein|nr:DUF3472 domain-containing protein [Gammaproteobacteria bacterium]
MKKYFYPLASTLLSINISYAVTPGHLMDAIYTWPQAVWETDLNFTITNDPGASSAYYWSHFFVFSNSSGFSRTGYAGLQTTGRGKQAIFSIWNALAANGANCATFGGEGVGYNCKLPYNFEQGRTYRVRVARLAGDSTGDWWGAWVSDVQTKVETTIGFIKSPANSGLIKTSYLFDEYFLNVANCNSMAYAKIGFNNLTGNLGSVTPTFNRWVPEGPCAGNISVQFSGNNFSAASPHA